MKRKGGGKAKGAAFERDVCKRLSLWYTQGKRDDVFWRSAMSGGRATLKGIAHVAGDICAVHSDGNAFVDQFFVECKHYRDLQLHRFLVGEGKLWSFWEQARRQADSHSKKPMLIARQGGGFPELLLLDAPGWSAIYDLGTVAVVKESAYVCLLSDLLGVKHERRPNDQRPPPHNEPARRIPVGAVPVAGRAGKAAARPKIVRARRPHRR